MSKATNLIKSVSDVMQEYTDRAKYEGRYFNLFEIVGVGTDEVKMCKMLAEIINPTGSHFQGNIYLKYFIQSVLKIEMDNDEMQSAKVYTEYLTDLNRRIDIVIVTKGRFIPVEVKIYAADQYSQCKDYYEFAFKQRKKYKSKVFYLTIDGHLPQNDGSFGLTAMRQCDKISGYNEVVPISFKEDICNWLEMCINDSITKDKPVITENLKQFRDTVERFCGIMDESLINQITSIISSNSDNMRIACSISDNINSAKEAMLKRLFVTLEKKIKELRPDLEQLNNKFDYKYDDYFAIKTYYKHNRSTYPALTYRYKIIDSNREIWFRIEVNYNLFAGFVVSENGGNPQKQILTKEEFKKYIPCVEPEIDGWWAYWEFLPEDDKNAAYTPNFKINNDIFYNLFDENYFNKFVDDCVEQILNLIKRI